MWRIPLRVAAGLTIFHGALTFAFAIFVFPGSALDKFVFAQHAFAFVFIACLNLFVLGAPSGPRVARYALHASNVAFLGVNVAIGTLKPEPATFTAIVFLSLLTLTAFMRDMSLQRTARIEIAAA